MAQPTKLLLETPAANHIQVPTWSPGYSTLSVWLCDNTAARQRKRAWSS